MEIEGQSNLVHEVSRCFSNHDFLECARKLEIPKCEFFSDQTPSIDLAERFVERVFQLEKEDLLENYLLDKNIKLNTSNRSAEAFGKLLNVMLKELDKTDKSDKSEYFKECELIEPIDIEKKMREKAHLTEDLIQAGINIKPDIVVLRKKAKALNYSSYEKLIQKLAKFYIHTICVKYPVETVPSSERFSRLYHEILNIIPDKLYNEIVDIEANVEGLIYETLSKCLIFNE